ncbi:MAG: AAA family ATPase [Caldilineaceae bacterium]|nr:AAA family ATPase [Caldilineaceae bacterium]
MPRPRLLALLDDGLARRLTLVSAPAGFGKTTLVSAWLAARARPAAWLSLDSRDGDPVRFLTYVVAALRTALPAIGEREARALAAPQPPPAESILTALVNALAMQPDPLVLVLDDYHVVDAPPVDEAVAFLLDHLPPHVHLVITTREDPRLPLARLRARGQMVDVRAADLRFTPAEAAAFLEQATGLALAAADVAALEARTEGWIAGLQLAALSMRGRADVHGFVQAFAGDNRYIVDYLVEVVLARRPDAERAFLLRSLPILDRLCGDTVRSRHRPGRRAADARQAGRAQPLRRGPGRQRRWYRFITSCRITRAHLLARKRPAPVAALHRQA